MFCFFRRVFWPFRLPGMIVQFHLTFMGNIIDIIIVKGDCKPTNITGGHLCSNVFNPAFLFAGPRREGRLHEGPWFAADVSQCLGHSLGFPRLDLQQQWFHRNGGHWGRLEKRGGAGVEAGAKFVKLWANTVEGQVFAVTLRCCHMLPCYIANMASHFVVQGITLQAIDGTE